MDTLFADKQDTAPPSRDLIEPGIYFGLPEDVYHADPALGSTSIKELVLDPIEYQYAKLHGGERKETMALKWGSAIHCRALEGSASLKARFPIAPSIADFDKPLVTMDDLRAKCKEMAVKPGKTKLEAIAAIRDFDKDVVIWDELVAAFNAANEGKTIIPREALNEIEQAVSWMQQDKYLAPVMEDGTLTAGASEVSIFYVDDGVRLKARIDHLLAHAVVDLKSFRPVMAERVKPAAKRAISRMRYDLQAAAYIRALKAAAALHVDGKVFNNPYPASFLDEVFQSVKTGDMQWVWVLIKAAGAPQPIVAEFDIKSMIFRTALVEVEDAINAYRENVKTFGLDRDWRPSSSVEMWGDSDFPAWAFS
jgi:hypothetical protein